MRNITRVYISHTSGDKAIAQAVATELRKNDIDVWSDEKSLSLGDAWAEVVTSALDSSDAIIAILSKHSYSSSWVRSELENALFNEKFKGKFLPVLIGKDKAELSRLPWVLSKISHLQLSPNDSPAVLAKKIVHEFLQYLGREQSTHDS